MKQQDNNIEYTVSAIVSKYQKHREEVDDQWNDKGHALELLGFLYINGESEQEKNQELIEAINNWQFNYESGFLTKKEETFLTQFQYKESVDYCINQYLNDNKKPCDQNNNITEYVCSELRFSKGTTIWNPFAGIMPYAFASNKEKKYLFSGVEENFFYYIAAIIRSNAYGIELNINCGDVFEALKSKQKRKAIVATIPDELDGHTVQDVIEDLYNSLCYRGKMYLIAPSSFLVSYSSLDIRMKITGNLHLNKIVRLPDERCFIVIEKKKQLDVIFEDATLVCKDSSNSSKSIRPSFSVDTYNHILNNFDNKDENFSFFYGNNKKIHVKVSVMDIAHNNFNWLPYRYILDDCYEEYINLGEIVEPVKKNITQDINYNEYVVGPDSVLPGIFESVEYAEGWINKIERTEKPGVREIKEEELCHYDKSMWDHFERDIQDGDKPIYFKIERDTPFVVVGLKEFHIGYSEGYNEELIVDPHLDLLIPKEGYTPAQLAYIIDLPVVRKQLESGGLGLFRDIMIPKLSLQERKNLVIEKIDSAKTEEQKAAEQRFDKYEKEIHVRKHAISQNLSSFEALWNVVNTYRETHDGKLSDDDVMGVIHKVSVGDAFKTLDKYLKVLMNQAEHLAQVEYDWGDDTLIDPNKFIKAFISNTVGTRYTNVYEEAACEDCATVMPYEALTRVFHNIVSNAVSHGFTNSEREDYKIKFDWFLSDEYIFITIENNGAPIPSSVKTDDLLIYGYSTALNEDGHSGIGAYEISNIMSSQYGSVQIISSPKEEYTVKYVIKCRRFNLEIEKDEDGEHRIYRCAVGGE